MGSLTLVGAGAGGDATASAVAADIADIARGIVDPVFGRPVDALVRRERASPQRHEGGYYVVSTSSTGRARSASSRRGWAKPDFARSGAAKAPHRRRPGPVVPVVLITHATRKR